MSIRAAATSDTASLTSGLPGKYPITLAGWVFIPSTLASLGSAWTVASRGDATDDTWVVQFKSIGGVYKFGTYASTTGDLFGSTTVTTNAWHNMAITVSAAGVVHGYLDGTVDAGLTGTLISSIVASTFQIGHSVAGDNAPFSSAGASFYGLKVWNAELSSTEIATEQTSYAAVRTTGLYATYLLTDVSTFTDSSGNANHLTRSGTSFVNDTDPPPIGGGGTSVALTGVGATTGLGTLVPGDAPGLTAPGAAGSPGTVSPGQTLALTAPGSTGSPGSVVAGRSLGLTAPSAAGSPGTQTPSISVGLTGVAATGAVGNVSPAGPTLSATPATGAVGTLGSARSLALTGQAGTAAPGTPGANITISISGVGGAAAPGSIGPGIAPAITASAATAAVGTFAVGPRSIAMTGIFGSSGVGTITAGAGLNSTPLPPYRAVVTFSTVQTYESIFNPSLARTVRFRFTDTLSMEIE